MRLWCSGNTKHCQCLDIGSIPVSRTDVVIARVTSSFQKQHSTKFSRQFYWNGSVYSKRKVKSWLSIQKEQEAEK